MRISGGFLAFTLIMALSMPSFAQSEGAEAPASLETAPLATAPTATSWATKAKFAIVVDEGSNEVLMEKEADTKMGPSSMTKLMTVYVAFDHIKKGNLKMSDKFVVSEKSWRTGGSKMFLPLGASVSVEELLHGVATQSGNDACIALAEGVAGTEEAYVQQMNDMAQHLGLKDSFFKNTTGLPDPEHHMTARDLALLAHHLIRDFPEYYSFFSLPDYTYNNIKQGNRNTLLTRGIGVDGLKTGFTDDNGYGIVVSGVQGDRRVTVVVNGLDTVKDRHSEAEQLYLYAMRNFRNITPYKAGAAVDNAPVWLGVKDTVPLVVDRDVTFLESTRPGAQNKKVRMNVAYEGPVQAPIAKGTELGKLTLVNGDKTEEYKLLAGEDIAKQSAMQALVSRFNYFVTRKKD